MAFKDMLDQMLAAGRDLANQGQAYAEQKLNVPSSGPERDAALSTWARARWPAARWRCCSAAAPGAS